MIYSNESVRRHLKFDKLSDSQEESKANYVPPSIKEVLETTVLEEFSPKSTNKKELTVFDFIMSYAPGNLFELKSVKVQKSDQASNIGAQSVSSLRVSVDQPVENDKRSEPNSLPSNSANTTNQPPQDQSSTQLILPSSSQAERQEELAATGYARKFLSANMFNLRAQGNKVLVLRDETLIVFTQELKKTRDVMPEFTSHLMANIDQSASIAQSGMFNLIPYIQPGARDHCD